MSALGVSVRAQVLNLLKELQSRLSLTYLFISHDLSVVEHICDRVAIMYLGQMVELGTTEQIFRDPRHPYTQALLSAIPVVGKSVARERILLKGDVPSPAAPPAGCRFSTRCRYAGEGCGEKPALAAYIGKMDMCAFVMDYDYNAPDPESLWAAHFPFYRTVRQMQPELPILCLSRPSTWNGPPDLRRQEIVRETVERARAAGDRRIWFLNEGTFFDGEMRECCTVDGVHPNDLGAYRIARAILPVLKEILSDQLRAAGAARPME